MGWREWADAQQAAGVYPEDDCDPAPAGDVAAFACWECGREYLAPADAGERFCSRACDDAWCERSAREAAAARAAHDGYQADGGGGFVGDDDIPY